jgi:hypothetical protein
LVPAFAAADAVLTTIRSALEETVVDTVALLLLGFVSAFGPEMVAVLLRVPVALGSMFAVSVNCALAPEANWPIDPIEQLTVPLVPTPGVLQTNVGPVFCTIETNVVPAGSGSSKVVGAEVSGPLFEAVIVQEIWVPEFAVAGPIFVMARSLELTVSANRLLLLSGLSSVVDDDTLAVFENVVPLAVPLGMCPVSVKVAVTPAARLAIVQVIVPPKPGEGWLLQSKAGPLFCVMETNVIVPGRVSVSEKLRAGSGPPLFTVIA